jgi:hypothetical protein
LKIPVNRLIPRLPRKSHQTNPLIPRLPVTSQAQILAQNHAPKTGATIWKAIVPQIGATGHNDRPSGKSDRNSGKSVSYLRGKCE